jgi:hypothetical protein
MDRQQNIAGGGFTYSRLALPAESDSLAVVDARGNLYSQSFHVTASTADREGSLTAHYRRSERHGQLVS